MTRLPSKGIYTVKVGNQPCANMLPKSEIVRRGGYKCRTLEMHLQLKDQQLKTISYLSSHGKQLLIKKATAIVKNAESK